jgi:hypothetical protein
MTLAEILATFPVGSDERLEALAKWRQTQDRLVVQERETRPPAAKPRHVESHVAGAIDKQRREWEDRKAAAERQREAEVAAAIMARVTKALKLTCARVSAVADPGSVKRRWYASRNSGIIGGQRAVGEQRGTFEISFD